MVTAGTVICGFLLYEVATYHPDTFRTATLGIPYAFYDTWRKKQSSVGSPKYLWDVIGENASEPKIDGLEWKGNGPPGSSKGAWQNPETGENFHPDFDHPEPIGTHWDYIPDKTEKGYRLFPDNSWEQR